MSGAVAPSWAGLPSLDWRSVTSSRDAKFGVKGTVLAAAFFGRNHRFLIEEVRSLDADGFWSTTYRARDAQTVSDAQVAAGKMSEVVTRSDDLREVIEFCREDDD